LLARISINSLLHSTQEPLITSRAPERSLSHQIFSRQRFKPNCMSVITGGRHYVSCTEIIFSEEAAIASEICEI
jgi:hypothetical protein